MGYPAAYRSGSSQYQVPGFQPAPIAANDNTPSVRVPSAANDNLPPAPSNSGPTALSAGVRNALRLGAMIGRGTPYGRAAGAAAQALGALSHMRPDKTHGSPPSDFPDHYPWTVPEYAEGWQYQCGVATGGAGTLCGPYVEPGAVSCNLSGQAANPAGLCVPVNTMTAATQNYSVVWDYDAGLGWQRAYVFWYHRVLPDPESTSDPAKVPMPARGHKPTVSPLPDPPPAYPPAQPIGAPAHWPRTSPFLGLNNEYHQVGPLPFGPPEFPPFVPRSPPPLGHKEKKFSAVGLVAYAFAAGITEGHDFLSAVWMALPKEDRAKVRGRKLGGKTLFPGDPGYIWGKPVNQTFGNMVNDLYNHWDDIDWNKAQGNIVKALAVDALVGVPAIIATRNFNKSRYSSGGFRGFWGPAM